MKKEKEAILKALDTSIKVVGIDVANSTLKAWTNDKHISYRNTIKEIEDQGLVFSFKDNYHMYVYRNEVFEVGDISSVGSGSRGKARYTTKSFRTEAVIGITSVLKPGPVYKLRVVTGVPSALIKDKEVVENIKNVLLGMHKVDSVFYDSKETIEFEIVDVIVVPQPLGTMYSYVYDEKTQKLNEKLIEQRALVVDIGWGTTDIAMLEYGRVRATFGFDIGTSDYISAIQEEVNNDMPQAHIQSLNPHQLDIMLLNSTIVETPFGTFDLAAYTESNKEKQSEKIYSQIMALGFEFNKFYKLIFTGGGSLLYEKYLRQKFNDPRFMIEPNPIEANTHGFYLLGKY